MSLSGIFDPVVRAYFNGKSGGSSGSSGGVAVSWERIDQLNDLPFETYTFEGDTGTITLCRLTDYLTVNELDGSMLLGARKNINGDITSQMFHAFSVSDGTVQSIEIADGVVINALIIDGEQSGMSIPKEAASFFGVSQGTYLIEGIFTLNGAFVSGGCKIA